MYESVMFYLSLHSLTLLSIDVVILTIHIIDLNLIIMANQN